jgi:acetyl esterase/lipase
MLDAEDVMLYVFAQETSWKTSNITIGGFSAGGNLALGQASKLSSRVRAVRLSQI